MLLLQSPEIHSPCLPQQQCTADMWSLQGCHVLANHNYKSQPYNLYNYKGLDHVSLWVRTLCTVPSITSRFLADWRNTEDLRGEDVSNLLKTLITCHRLASYLICTMFLNEDACFSSTRFRLSCALRFGLAPPVLNSLEWLYSLIGHTSEVNMHCTEVVNFYAFSPPLSQ